MRVVIIFRKIVILILAGILFCCGAALWQIYNSYEDSNKVQAELLKYKPNSSAENAATDGSGIANNSIIELQGQNAEVRGWLMLDDTNIDYLYVQAPNNNYYLNHGIDGSLINSGTLFMDYRCPPDFTAFNNIIYGHKMKNGTMFSDLLKFEETEFWESHSTGVLYLPYNTYDLQIVAYLVVGSADGIIYNPKIENMGDKQQYITYIQENAIQYRDIGISPDDTFLLLSTCNYEFTSARSVLLLKLIPPQ